MECVPLGNLLRVAMSDIVNQLFLLFIQIMSEGLKSLFPNLFEHLEIVDVHTTRH